MTPRDDIQGEPKPALTPEEWREFLADGEYPARLRNVIGPDAERCHKAAAKLLHGQPFGFTWADVDMLRAIADFEASQQEYHGAEEIAGLRSLADRVAALLPPRTAIERLPE